MKTRHVAKLTFAVLLMGIFGTLLRGRGVLPEDKKFSPLQFKCEDTQHTELQTVDCEDLNTQNKLYLVHQKLQN